MSPGDSGGPQEDVPAGGPLSRARSLPLATETLIQRISRADAVFILPGIFWAFLLGWTRPASSVSKCTLKKKESKSLKGTTVVSTSGGEWFTGATVRVAVPPGADVTDTRLYRSRGLG